MRRMAIFVVALWQIEMAVHSGIAASRRPMQPAVVDVRPTPTPSRAEPPACAGPSCQKQQQPTQYRIVR